MVSRTPLGSQQAGLIVEFLNTLDLRTYGSSQGLLERDELADPAQAHVWLTARGLVSEQAAVSFDYIGELRLLRDELRALLSGEGDFSRTIDLNAVLRPGASSLVPPAVADTGLAARVLQALTLSVLEGSWARVRICGAPDCRRAFVDTSRNGRGRWCSMKTCGNRMKTRAYRRRKTSAVRPAGTKVRPGARSRSGSFRRLGEYWSITYARQTFHLKDSKGLAYIAKLLADPGREFHVLDLVSLGPSPMASKPARAYELIDPAARRAYGARLEDLREELAEAEEWGDSGRARRAREEIDLLAAELSRATGRTGRGRMFASDSERARVSVTRVIKAALLRIGDHSPELKHHFAATLKTGTYCSYQPDPRLPVRWNV
jgi:predicted RNA-binding Zn ribbon-like protein